MIPRWTSQMIVVGLTYLLLVQVIAVFGINTTSTLTGPLAPELIPKTLSLGWLGPLNINNSNSLVYGHPAFVAYQLAIGDINRDPDLLPNTTLIGLWADEHSNPSQVVTQAIKFAQTPNVVGIVGDYSSTHTQLIQYAIKPYKLTEVSASSTSIDFTTNHASQYPYYARVCANNQVQAKAMTALIISMGWKKVGIVNTNDPFGASGAAQNGNYLRAAGVSVLTSTSFNQGDTDLSFLLSQLINSKARIIIYWGLTGDLLTLWRYAVTQTPNLLGDGYQWIIPQAVADNSLFSSPSGGFLQEVFNLGVGVLGLQYRVRKTVPEFQTFWNHWQDPSNYASNQTLNLAPSINPSNPKIAAFAPLVYDIVGLYARTLHRMIYELGVDPSDTANFPLLYQTLVGINFTGASGFLSLSPIGDRIIDFDLVNLQSATKSFEIVAEIDSAGTTTLLAGQKIQFMGPLLENQPKPLDALVRGIQPIPKQTTIALQVVTSFVIGVAVVLTVVTYATAERPVMKASSPSFLALFLLGISLLASSVYSRTLESLNQLSPGPCLSDLFLGNLGYTLIVGALLVKTIRLRVLFLSTKLKVNKSLPDVRLLLWLIGGVFAESMLLMALQLSHGMSIELKSFDDTDDYWACTAAGDEDLVKIYLPVTIAARFLLLLSTAVCSWQVRNIPDVFNESKQLLVTVYNLLFLSILLPAIDATMGRGKESALIAYSVCVFFICLVSMGILFVPKLLVVYSNDSKSKSTSGHHHHHGSQPHLFKGSSVDLTRHGQDAYGSDKSKSNIASLENKTVTQPPSITPRAYPKSNTVASSVAPSAVKITLDSNLVHHKGLRSSPSGSFSFGPAASTAAGGEGRLKSGSVTPQPAASLAPSPRSISASYPVSPLSVRIMPSVMNEFMEYLSDAQALAEFKEWRAARAAVTTSTTAAPTAPKMPLKRIVIHHPTPSQSQPGADEIELTPTVVNADESVSPIPPTDSTATSSPIAIATPTDGNDSRV